MKKEPDIKTLPKWAQCKIRSLESQLARTVQAFNNLSEPKPTNTAHNIYGPLLNESPLLYLPDWTRVRFYLDNVKIVVGIDKMSGELEITASNNLLLKFRGTGALSLSAENKDSTQK